MYLFIFLPENGGGTSWAKNFRSGVQRKGRVRKLCRKKLGEESSGLNSNLVGQRGDVWRLGREGKGARM